MITMLETRINSNFVKSNTLGTIYYSPNSFFNMKYLLSLACMCLFLFVSPQIQSQEVPADKTRVHIDLTSNSASCNGCTTTYNPITEYMTISCYDGSGWRGTVPDFNGTVCGEDLG